MSRKVCVVTGAKADTRGRVITPMLQDYAASNLDGIVDKKFFDLDFDYQARMEDRK